MNIDTLENIENVENIEQTRQNPLCVISIATYGDYEMHDIQTNSGWAKNPYGEEYAVVPDDMVQDIMETRGFCDIVLNDEKTEVVSFTAREIPVIQEPEQPVSEIEQIRASAALIAKASVSLTRASEPCHISSHCRQLLHRLGKECAKITAPLIFGVGGYVARRSKQKRLAINDGAKWVHPHNSAKLAILKGTEMTPHMRIIPNPHFGLLR